MCKLRSGDTATAESERLLAVTPLAGSLCVFGKQTLPKIEQGGVNKRNFFFPVHKNILLDDFVCTHKLCKVSEGRMIPLESR